jgi:predicted phage terminase large subunit-like protein
MRNTTKEWFLEAVPTRLNNPKKSAIVVIMQRLHEEDVSGIILEKNLGYDHLMLPMQFDSDRRCRTSIGFEDPRQEDGELLFPKRFPLDVVERDKLVMGPYASSGQFQQSPVPRGGGIIKRDYWQLWDDETAQSQGISSSAKYPPMDYVVASLDPAFTSKKENDPSALTIWGVWQKGGQSARRILGRTGDVVDYIDDRDTVPCLMLMHAWAKRLPIHGSYTERMPGETEEAFKLRQQENWGLVEWVVDTCSRYNIDTLLIESKGSGISVSQEIQRLNRTLTWSVHQINPGNADKVARAYAVQPIFSNGTVYAPDRAWADKVITEAENFPKGKHDDLVDSTTQALKFMRERGLLRRPEEIIASIKNEVSSPFRVKPIYDV